MAEKIEKWGKAIIVACTILVGTAAVASKIVETVKAGPDALVKTGTLEKKVKRLDHRTKFIVRGITKLTGEKYSYRDEERAAESLEEVE